MCPSKSSDFSKYLLVCVAQLIGRVEAEVLMTGAAQPGSPQPSSGSPSTPQQESKPRQDFLRADLTPLTDITPLDVKPTPLPSGQPGAFSSVLSPIDAKPIPILMSQHCPGSSSTLNIMDIRLPVGESPCSRSCMRGSSIVSALLDNVNTQTCS